MRVTAQSHPACRASHPLRPFSPGIAASRSGRALIPNLSGRFLTILVLVSLSGCGPRPPVMVEVSGEVIYDGIPVPGGTVSLVPADGGGAPVLLTIVAGRYAGLVPVGTKRVEIRGLRLAARPLPSTGGPGAEEAEAVEGFIPAKYNDQSGLSRELAPPGPLTIDFRLEK